jgi:uracil-DNA glycosylase
VRGSLPADVLFIGEAPGKNEDGLGKPFVGPAGHELDRVLSGALESVPPRMDVDEEGEPVERPIRFAYTNLVACIPRGEDGDKVAEPPTESIETCSPRLQELFRMADPRLVVLVGRLAEKWGPKICDLSGVKVISIVHPAAILQGSIAQKPLAIQLMRVSLTNALCDLVE